MDRDSPWDFVGLCEVWVQMPRVQSHQKPAIPEAIRTTVTRLTPTRCSSVWLRASALGAEGRLFESGHLDYDAGLGGVAQMVRAAVSNIASRTFESCHPC